MAHGLAKRLLALKRKMPAPLRRVADRLVASDGWLAGRMKSLVALGQPIPDPIQSGNTPVRLLISPLNYAGQGERWARASEKHLSGVSARSQAVDVAAAFRFPADDHIPATVYLGSQPWKRAQRVAVATFSHVLIESFASLYGGGTADAVAVAEDAVELEARGLRVGILFHGSDIRDPMKHRERHQWSPFREESTETATLAETVAEHRRALALFGGAHFVSTPDLLIDVPAATWLPVVVSPERWNVAENPALIPKQSQAFRVLHVPSAAGIKGTDFITPIGKKLQSEGLIEYVELRGIPAEDMPKQVAAADIVIDQLLIGSYGVAACEAMAAGRLVLGNVDQQVRGFLRELGNGELPVVQADPETLEGVLREIVANPDIWRDTARAGKDFVRDLHDGRYSSAVLRDFLGLEKPDHSGARVNM